MASTTPRPNHKALNLARRLELAAPQITATLDHIARELAYADGYPAATIGDGTSPANRDLTAVEAAADRRWQLAADRAQIHDDLEALDNILRSILTVCRYAQGTRLAPADKPRCTGGIGLEGYHLPRDDGGWSEPGCTNIPRSGRTGLCDACYKRMTRWRRLNNLKPLDDQVPAA